MSIRSIGGASGGPQPYVAPANGGGQVPEPVPVKSAPTAQPAEAPQSRPDTEQLQAALDQVQEFVATQNNNLKFSIDDETGKTVVRVVDSESGEMIRQIPSEEIMAIARSIGKLQGLLLHNKA